MVNDVGLYIQNHGYSIQILLRAQAILSLLGIRHLRRVHGVMAMTLSTITTISITVPVMGALTAVASHVHL